jgi:adenosylmethionine-8-amino-7-oxononanoate aminotransferase
MQMIRDICDRNGILLIADEVITAFGRTGAWTGSRLWGVKPDMTCIAKALTNGFFPLGAVMMNDKITEVFESDKTGGGNIASGYTYSGHPVGAAAAIACLAETQRLKVNENAAVRGKQLFDGIVALKEKYDFIGDVRGHHGLMMALELVSDRKTKAGPAKSMPLTVLEETYRNGAMIRVSGPNVILSPALIVNEAEINIILSALDAGLAAV